MKRLYALLSVVFFMTTYSARAQTCFGDFVFNSQEALDQFAIDNPICTEIDGSLHLQFGMASEGTPINNTDALQNIVTVFGRLTLEDNSQTSGYPVSLSGLSAITTVLELYVTTYSNLTSLEGLNNLTSVEYDLFFGMYGEDVSLAPLDNIIYVTNVTLTGGATASFENILPGISVIEGFLDIGSESPEMESITGFENLTYCVSLRIGSTGETPIILQTIDAFHNLEYCDEVVLYCSAETMFSGFESFNECMYLEVWSADAGNEMVFPVFGGAEVIYIGGDFTHGISFPSLISSQELRIEASGPISLPQFYMAAGLFVQSCGINAELELDLNDTLMLGQLLVQYNDFEDMSFLPQNTTIEEYLTIAYNENLSYCGHPAICAFIPIHPDAYLIEVNADGCNDAISVLSSCGETVVSGLIYYDADCNGIYDGNDYPMTNTIVQDGQGNVIAVSNLSGAYLFAVEDNTTTTFLPKVLFGFLPSTPITVDASTLDGNLLDQDFAVCHDVTQYNVSVHFILQEQLRPGFPSSLAVLIENQTWSAVSGTVTVYISQMIGTSVVSAFGGIIDGSEITFAYTDLQAFTSQSFYFTLQTNADVPLGTMQTLVASIALDGGNDNYTLDDSATVTLQVIGSYDPNDISVNRPDIDFNNYNAAEGEWLEYLIRFQNTGTAEAIFIHVLDTIPVQLDLASIEILETSHAMEMRIDGREVDFFFDDINLPDSTSNPEGSQGFVFYRIHTLPNLTLEDVIPNQGAIYFDFNAPIYTNIATTSFYLECPAEPVISGLDPLCGPGVFNLSATSAHTDYTWIIDGETSGSASSFSFTSNEVSEIPCTLIAEEGLCEVIVPFVLITQEAVVTPEITQEGNTLTASGAGSFMWFFNGEMLTETSNTMEATASGVYSVQLTNDGCTSDLVELNHTFIGIESLSMSAFRFYPNPADEVIRFETTAAPSKSLIEIYSAAGALIYSTTNNANIITIDCKQWSPGMYLIRHRDLDTGQNFSDVLIVD